VIYAALGSAEVWRFDGEQFVIDRLGVDGRYQATTQSRFLPLMADEILRWVVEEDTGDESTWRLRIRAWARAELVPRLPRCGRASASGWHRPDVPRKFVGRGLDARSRNA
jgi:hypothetical protein